MKKLKKNETSIYMIEAKIKYVKLKKRHIII